MLVKRLVKNSYSMYFYKSILHRHRKTLQWNGRTELRGADFSKMRVGNLPWGYRIEQSPWYGSLRIGWTPEHAKCRDIRGGNVEVRFI